MADPLTVDPLEADAACALKFETGSSSEYCTAAAREWLALWRHVTDQDEGPQQPATLDRAAVELAVSQERARTVGMIRDRQDELMRDGNKEGTAWIRLNELVTILHRIEGRA